MALLKVAIQGGNVANLEDVLDPTHVVGKMPPPLTWWDAFGLPSLGAPEEERPPPKEEHIEEYKEALML